MVQQSNLQQITIQPKSNRLFVTLLSLIIVSSLFLTACDFLSGEDSGSEAEVIPPDAGSCGLEAASDNDEDAITAVLTAEGALMVAQDIVPLMNLWDEKSQVVDAKNTPQDDDNQLWIDKDAIRHRYVHIVFPGAPTAAKPLNVQIDIQDNIAIVKATTQIGGEISPAGDRWELVNKSGCWLISKLTYNLERSE